MPVYSHSKLSTFEQCPQKYKFRYIDRIKPDYKRTIEAHLGSAVHNALEWLYKKVIAREELPSVEGVIQKYSEEWEKDFDIEMKIVNQDLTFKDYFNKGVEFLVSYYLAHKPFDDGTFELEKKIWISLDSERSSKIIGYIDRLVFNKEKNCYEVHDYKTANSLPTQEKMDEDRQLALYAIAVKEEFGKEKEVVLIWHYLAHNRKIVSRRTNEQLEELKKNILELIRKIESCESFEPAPSLLCKWCEFRSNCPAFKNGFQKDCEKKEESYEGFEKSKQTNLGNYPTVKKYLRD